MKNRMIQTVRKRRAHYGSSAARRVREWPIPLAVAGGLVALAWYLNWWLTSGLLASPVLLLVFVAAVAYSSFQLIGNWVLFLAAPFRLVRPVSPVRDLTVDVFVTVCGEDQALIRKCLASACAMRGKPKVWLLDDGPNPTLEGLAQESGAGYLSRENRKDAKAGNLNAALARTDGEIIAIFDVDHVPEPAYLERTVHHFADPAVGFVQVMVTFDNNRDGWVAQAAAESSFDFYNPTSKGMDALDSVTMMGSNSLIRRTALTAISDYQPGLAEDLATSLALHAAGWRSVYVAEPLAPGIAPPDLVSWFTQQFKWARGVFSVLLGDFPRVWSRLDWGERVAYGVRMTMYWLGPVICAHLVATIAVLFWGNQEVLARYGQYLLYLMPLAASNVLIHWLALQRWRHPALPAPSWKAVMLVYVTWPLYTLAWVMALLHIPLAFRPTPKTPGGRLNLWWLTPQALTSSLLLAGILYHFSYAGYTNIAVLLAALMLALPQLLFFLYCWGWNQLQPCHDLQGVAQARAIQ